MEVHKGLLELLALTRCKTCGSNISSTTDQSPGGLRNYQHLKPFSSQIFLDHLNGSGFASTGSASKAKLRNVLIRDQRVLHNFSLGANRRWYLLKPVYTDFVSFQNWWSDHGIFHVSLIFWGANGHIGIGSTIPRRKSFGGSDSFLVWIFPNGLQLRLSFFKTVILSYNFEPYILFTPKRCIGALKFEHRYYIFDSHLDFLLSVGLN